MTDSEPKRDELLDALMRLPPGAFDTLLFRMGIPVAYISAPSAPPAVRAIDVIRYAENIGKIADLQAAMREVESTRAEGPGALRRQTSTILSAALAVFGLLLLISREEIQIALDHRTLVPFIAGSLLILQGVVFLLLQYLRGGWRADVPAGEMALQVSPSPNASDGVTAELEGLRRAITDMQAKMSNLAASKAAGSPGDMAPIINDVKEHVLKTIADELEKRLDAKFNKSAHVTAVRRVFSTTVLRLREELAAVGRRGNLNLVIGILTTVSAVVLLAYMVLKAPDGFENVSKTLSHYVPKVTTVIFIEVFSFFFLRLYKQTLAEMQYYQNQLTALAQKEGALEAALSTGDAESVKHVIEQLSLMSMPSRNEPESASLKDVGEFIEKVGKTVAEVAKGGK